MENNKTDKCQNEDEKKYQNKSDTEIKLESKEYLDSRIHDFDRIDQKVKDYKQELISLIKWYCWIFGIVVAIGGWGAYYGFYNQFKNLLSSRLDKEFESEKIQKLIEDKAKEFAEKKAEKFLSDKTKDLLVPLEEKMKLYNIADRAEGGSKDAYLELQEVAKRENGDIAMIAKTKLISIKRTLDIYSIIPGVYPNITYKKPSGDIAIEMMSFDEVINVMENDPNMTTIFRAACMVYISHKPDKEILQKALQVLETSDSLPTCAAFMGVLYSKVGPKAAVLDFENWIRVCREELKN